MDWFLTSMANADVPEEVKDHLIEHAELFLRAYGRIDWDKWAQLSSLSRAAFALAGDRIRNEDAIRGGHAINDLEGFVDEHVPGAAETREEVNILLRFTDKVHKRLGILELPEAAA